MCYLTKKRKKKKAIIKRCGTWNWKERNGVSYWDGISWELFTEEREECEEREIGFDEYGMRWEVGGWVYW